MSSSARAPRSRAALGTHRGSRALGAIEAAQERFGKKIRGKGSSHAKRDYVLAGMVKCCSGHGPLSMQGKLRKGHHYYCCGYGSDYGEAAAIEAHAGQKWISAREDRLLRLVLSFFEERVFGPLRIERLEKQLRANAREHRKEGKLAGTRIRQQVAARDRKIKAQIQALEKGIEPELISERISELRREKEVLEEALSEIGAEREEAEVDELSKQLARVPDWPRRSARRRLSFSARSSRPSSCRSSTTRRIARSKSRPLSRRPSPKPSRSRKPSRRRAHWW